MNVYDLPDALALRLDAYAERKRITRDDAIVALLDAGLRAHERAVHAGGIGGRVHTKRTMRKVANARWKGGAK